MSGSYLSHRKMSWNPLTLIVVIVMMIDRFIVEEEDLEQIEREQKEELETRQKEIEEQAEVWQSSAYERRREDDIQEELESQEDKSRRHQKT